MLWYVCHLALQKPQIVDKIVVALQSQFRQLNFNAGSQNPNSNVYGQTLLFLICSLALKGQLHLLDRVCNLPAELFRKFNFNAATLNPHSEVYGQTVLSLACSLARVREYRLLDKICMLPIEQFSQLNFNASPQKLDCPDYGITVLWYACSFAGLGRKTLLDQICALPAEQFNQLNFNAAPQNPKSEVYGITVLTYACILALKGQYNLLEKICTLQVDQFNQLNFNASPRNTDRTDYGITVFWAACVLAEVGVMSLLNKINTLPAEQFDKLAFHMTDKEGNSFIGFIGGNKNKLKKSVVYSIFRKVSSNQLTQIQSHLSNLNRYCQTLVSIKTATASFSETEEINLQPLLDRISALSEEERNYCYYLLAYNLPPSSSAQRTKLFQAVTKKTPDVFQESCNELMNSYFAQNTDCVETRLYNLATALYYALISDRETNLNIILQIVSLYLTTNAANLNRVKEIDVSSKIKEWVDQMLEEFSLQPDSNVLYQRMIDRLNISRSEHALNEMRLLLMSQQSDKQVSAALKADPTEENASSLISTPQRGFFASSR